jgi:3-hydroxybutyryl-CoA dehydrogenase
MQVERIAVIGAGALGRRIALAAVTSGYPTVLEDVSDVRLESARDWIVEKLRPDFAAKAAGGQGPGADANLAIAHTVEEAIRKADLIFETLPDEMEMQIELFTVLDRFAKPNAIFVSTGHSSITALAEVTFCAERCIGVQFGEGIDETKTVTLTRGAETSDQTVEACAEVVRRFGKGVMVVDPGG